MKKNRIVALLLALVMCFGLCACGAKENPADAYLGVWESDNMKFTLTEGGVGRFEVPNNPAYGYWDFTYEIKDDVLVISLDSPVHGTMTSNFELNEDGTSIKGILMNLPVIINNESEFVKQ